MDTDRFLRFDWLFIGIHDAEVVAVCLLIAVILLIWAGTLIVAAYVDTERRHDYRRYDPRRWFPPVFGFWLGVFMIWDAVIYLMLASLIGASPLGVVPLWNVIPLTALGASAIITFFFWGRDRLRS